MQCTLRTLADDTKLEGSADKLAGRASIQSNPVRLEKKKMD